MLADKHTRNAHLLSNPSKHAARGVPNQDALARTPLWSTMMRAFLSGNGRWDPKQADGHYFGQSAQSPQVLICPPPLLGHHPMVTSLLYQSEVIIQPMKDGDGKRKFGLGRIVPMSFHSWDSNAKFALRANSAATNPRPKWHPMVTGRILQEAEKVSFNFTFDSSELTLPPFVNSSQTDDPTIPGPSPSSKPHEDIWTCEPEPEVALKQSMVEPFTRPTPPHSVIIIDNTPIKSPPPLSPSPTPPHSLHVPLPLIPTMRLARDLLT
ncbi:hypothetical protein O181_070588 [Austropuccinia psidii MF-1]|uniref:Uncharacterized protein n=1 Tax=Austropuccinia psidii MF-1 TaxID=1389203 RepID=A0A9Q3I7E4_9BASI|nr:hypothetical protein [Austropuccinia psidii MF-1]